MKCPQCKDVMVLAQATSFGEQYHYCRTCKKELSEMATPLDLPNTAYPMFDAPSMVIPDERPVMFIYGSNSPCAIDNNGTHLHNIPYTGLRCSCGQVTT